MPYFFSLCLWSYSAIIVSGACKLPSIALKNPTNPDEFFYCHPKSLENGCPRHATCENLWLGLFVCCTTNNTSRNDHVLQADAAFSDTNPTNFLLKNRKNFANFLPAETSATEKLFESQWQFNSNSNSDTSSTAAITVSNIVTNFLAQNTPIFTQESTFSSNLPTSVSTVSNFVPSTFPSQLGVNEENITSGTLATVLTRVQSFNHQFNATDKSQVDKSVNSSDENKPFGTTCQMYVLQEGSNQKLNANTYKFPSSVTLIKDSGKSMIIDTGLPTDYNLLELFLSEISRYGVEADTVDAVVTTHGHPDHFGHLNIFPSAVQYFGGLMYYGTTFAMSEVYNNEIAQFTSRVTLHKTPGHTAEDLSVIAKNVSQYGTVAIVGDLFISKDDIDSPEIWESQAWNTTIQFQSRKAMLCASDYIVPGHGGIFKVEAHMRNIFNCKNIGEN